MARIMVVTTPISTPLPAQTYAAVRDRAGSSVNQPCRATAACRAAATFALDCLVRFGYSSGPVRTRNSSSKTCSYPRSASEPESIASSQMVASAVTGGNGRTRRCPHPRRSITVALTCSYAAPPFRMVPSSPGVQPGGGANSTASPSPTPTASTAFLCQRPRTANPLTSNATNSPNVTVVKVNEKADPELPLKNSPDATGGADR